MEQRSVVRVLAQQQALAEFGSYAFEQNNLEPIFQTAASLCAHSLSAPFARVGHYESLTNSITILAGFGWNDGVVGRREPVDNSPAQRAIASGQPVIVEQFAHLRDGVIDSYTEHNIVSSVTVIIKGADATRPFGILEINSPTHRIFDRHDISFLTGFANVLAERVAHSDGVAQLRRALREKEDLLRQKEFLLQELHHRVRNNLQLVHGMVSDPTLKPSRDTLQNISRRVMALAQVYDHLMLSTIPHYIDFGVYLNGLCHNLADLFSEQNMVLTCQADSLLMGLERATALALATNELLLIRLEQPGHGAVRVRLMCEDDSATMCMQASGILPNETVSRRDGLGLVRRLALQLRGMVIVDSDSHGTTVNFTFPTDTKKPSASIIDWINGT